MPWLPELFTVPTQQRLLDKRRAEKLLSVPFFDGLLTGELEPLADSFAGEPELYDPVRGRIKGARAFEAFVVEMREWLLARHAAVEDVERVILEERGFEEVVVRFDGEAGRVELPFALVADHAPDGRLGELRTYYDARPLTGRSAYRPPVLQGDPGLRAPGVVGEFHRALGDGDVDAVVAAFEADGYVREPAGGSHVHRGPDALRAFYEGMLSGGGLALDPCVVVDGGRTCALEYNLMGQPGVAMFVPGPSGRLAAARFYDDISRSQPWNGA